MDALLGEMTATLKAAQQAVEDELQQIEANQSPSSDRLAHLHGSVRDFWEQARSLLEMMLESNVDAERLYEVESLADFFSDTEARIAAMLKTGRTGP